MGGAALIGFGVGLQAYGAYRGLQAASASAKYQAQINRTNIALAKERIQDIRAIGAQVTKRLGQEAVEVVAGQVTSFASGNIDISSAVVTEATEEAVRTGAANIITAQHNIEKAVWGEEVGIMNEEAQALFNEAQAKSARKFAPIAAGTTLITGAGSLFATRQRVPETQRDPLKRFRPRGVLPQNPNIAVDLPPSIFS